MKILIIARGYPSKKYKMNGIFEYDQAKALTEQGHQVIYAAVDLRSIRRKRKWGYESFMRDGMAIRILNIPCGKIPDQWLSQIGIMGFKKLYKYLLKEFGEFEIIHSHFIYTSYIVAKQLVEQGHYAKFIVTEHYSDLNKPDIEKQTFEKAKFTYRSCDQLIAVSKPFANNIQKKFNIKPIVIPNIVDLDAFSFHKRSKNEGFQFISVGGLTKIKRMDILIEAFIKMNKSYLNTKLVICGEGDQRKKLEDQIKKSGLQKKIILLGMCSRQIIASEMLKSDCFVLVSESETFGVAYIEAMATGLPIIATRCGGPEDFVTKENGILIDKNNMEELINAMKEMYHSTLNYDAEIISKRTRASFSPKNIVTQLEEVYKK